MIRFPWRNRASPAPSSQSHTESSQGTLRQGPGAQSVPCQPTSPGSVPGERGYPIVSGARSLQSRMSSLLAAALMTSVGAGMLAWYYAEALSRPAAVRSAMHASLPENAGEGVTLPSFAAIAEPAAARPAPASSVSGPSPPLAVGPAYALLEPPLAPARAGGLRGNGVAPRLSPRGQALERRLSGEVFAAGGRDSSPALSPTAGDAQSTVPPGATSSEERAPTSDALQALLRPSVLGATSAQVLPTQRLLLPKGTFIDCTLETAIDSTLPGMTTCVTATDTFGADGTVVLLERGTKLIGETRGEVQQGQARVFVVWTEARTAAGVVVRLDSPGTDALGRSGLEGEVNRHFWQRFGAAALVSTIDGIVQAKVQSSSRGGTVVLDPTASEDVLTEILRSTVNIPPTIRVRNGARIQVLVARDVDFRSVYELEPR